MDGYDVGNGIVQLGACKEVMKPTKQKLLTATSGLADCPAVSFRFVCLQTSKCKTVELGDQLH